MVTTIFATAIFSWIILGIMLVGVCLIDAATDTTHDVIGLTIAVLWIASIGVCLVCRIGFSDTLDKETLDMVKERHARLLERCPTEVGECEIKWLDYRADSLRAEYKVQRLKYE